MNAKIKIFTLDSRKREEFSFAESISSDRDKIILDLVNPLQAKQLTCILKTSEYKRFLKIKHILS